MIYYTTTKQRVLLTEQDLSYAVDPNTGLIQPQEIRSCDIKKINDCPDLHTARLVELAQEYLPRHADHAKNCRHLKTALRQTAIEAAVANQECLALQGKGNNPTCAPYPYIYSTDKHHYALTRQPMYKATAANPSTIIESKAVKYDNDIIFVSQLELATFLAKYTCAHFCTPEEPIDVWHNPENYYKNRIQVQVGNHCMEYFIRDGQNRISLSVAAKSDSNIQKMYLSAAEHQLAACNIYRILIAEKVVH